jgi:hypothetical protein
MSASRFFIAARKTDACLRDVASAVFSAIGVGNWEERYSSNYPPDDHYFAGYSENAEVTVSDADDRRKPDYPFLVSVENSSWRKGPGIIATDVPSVAKALVAGGFTVFVPVGAWWQIDWNGEGKVYTA